MITPPPTTPRPRKLEEEAGVRGTVADAPLGAFRYHKRMKSARPSGAGSMSFRWPSATEAKDWPETAPAPTALGSRPRSRVKRLRA